MVDSIKENIVYWWLTPQDIAFIEPDLLPEYIHIEIEKLIGRNGRGRLWISNIFSREVDYSIYDWPFTPLAKYIEHYCGGILIRSQDYDKLKNLPGIFTNYRLERL